MKLAFITAALLAATSPALANTWAIQDSGSSYCNRRYDGSTAPTAGANYPVGAACVSFVPINNDLDVTHYQVTSGALVYAPGGVVFTPPNTGTTVNGTAGTFYWAESVDPNTGIKEIVAAFSGYTQVSNTVAFPVPFTVTPSVIGNTLSGITGVTLTKNGILFAANNVNGTVSIKGY